MIRVDMYRFVRYSGLTGHLILGSSIDSTKWPRLFDLNLLLAWRFMAWHVSSWVWLNGPGQGLLRYIIGLWTSTQWIASAERTENCI